MLVVWLPGPLFPDVHLIPKSSRLLALHIQRPSKVAFAGPVPSMMACLSVPMPCASALGATAGASVESQTATMSRSLLEELQTRGHDMNAKNKARQAPR